MKTAFRYLLIFFILSTNVWASSTSEWFSIDKDHKATLNVELYLSSTCPHCQKANAFFHSIEANYPWLHIQYNFIDKDKNSLIRFNQLLIEQQKNDFAVPSIFFCNTRWLGFATAETTGKDLLQALNYCKQQIEKKGELNTTALNTIKHWANANQYDSGMVAEKPTDTYYMTTIALVDSLNPCALFGFAGFLAFLFIEEKRKKQFIAGILFISAVEIVHYVQQTQSSIFYELLSWLRLPAALLGCVMIYFIIQRYKKQFNDRLYFVLAFLFGLVSMIYQQTCLMNWSYVFEQWLNNKHLSSMQYGLYQLYYQSVYVLPMLLALAISIAIINRKGGSALKSRLISIGFLLIIAIALCLIIYPVVLSYFNASCIAVLILIVLGYFLNLP